MFIAMICSDEEIT